MTSTNTQTPPTLTVQQAQNALQLINKMPLEGISNQAANVDLANALQRIIEHANEMQVEAVKKQAIAEHLAEQAAEKDGLSPAARKLAEIAKGNQELGEKVDALAKATAEATAENDQ